MIIMTEPYTRVVLTIIALSLIVQLFFSLWQIFLLNKTVKNENTTLSSTFQKTIDDLDKLIQRKCYVAYRRALEPYVNKALKNRPLINDTVVNNISIQITKEVLEEMSESYRAKLEEIYNAEKLDDIILELVYNTVTEMAMNINKTSINKMNLISRFGSISRTDFDK